MPLSGFRPRIHDSGERSQTCAVPRTRADGFDYAALLRRARSGSAMRAASNDSAPPISPEPSRIVPPTPQLARPDMDWVDLHCADTDYIDAMGRHQAHATALCAAIAGHVASFCTDPAVTSRGNWMLRIRLDPVILPDCILQLDLSFLRLMLRFETRQADTRQIVLRHVDTLEASLSALLRRHSAVQDLEIVVW